MGFQFEHLYFSVIGDAYNAEEGWQFGFRCLDLDPATTLEAIALAAAPVVERWWTQAGYQAAAEFKAVTTHRLTELKVARIGVDGKYLPGSVAYSHFYLPPIVGSEVVPAGMLPQGTTAVTLTTAQPRGLASQGRVFLPPHQRLIPDSDGRLPQSYCVELAAVMKQFINELNAVANFGPVSVMSKGKGVKVENVAKQRYEWTYPNPGVTNAVTGVSVGRVVDTQRRRRRQLVEAPSVIQLA